MQYVINMRQSTDSVLRSLGLRDGWKKGGMKKGWEGDGRRKEEAERYEGV